MPYDSYQPTLSETQDEILREEYYERNRINYGGYSKPSPNDVYSLNFPTFFQRFYDYYSKQNPYNFIRPNTGLFGAYLSSMGLGNSTAGLYGNIYKKDILSRYLSSSWDYDKYIKEYAKLQAQLAANKAAEYQAWYNQAWAGV